MKKERKENMDEKRSKQSAGSGGCNVNMIGKTSAFSFNFCVNR